MGKIFIFYLENLSWKFVLKICFELSFCVFKLHHVFIRPTSYKFLYHWVIFEVFMRVLVCEINFVKSSQTSSSEHDVRWDLKNFIIKIWNFIDDKIEDLKVFRFLWPYSCCAIAKNINWCLIKRKISDQQITIWL